MFIFCLMKNVKACILLFFIPFMSNDAAHYTSKNLKRILWYYSYSTFPAYFDMLTHMK